MPVLYGGTVLVLYEQVCLVSSLESWPCFFPLQLQVLFLFHWIAPSHWTRSPHLCRMAFQEWDSLLSVRSHSPLRGPKPGYLAGAVSDSHNRYGGSAKSTRSSPGLKSHHKQETKPASTIQAYLNSSISISTSSQLSRVNLGLAFFSALAANLHCKEPPTFADPLCRLCRRVPGGSFDAPP